MSNFLYRLRDADGALLYVGVTNDWPSRFKQHQRDKAWFPAVAVTEIVPIGGSRAQLEAIEKAVIQAEKPVHNVMHNLRGSPVITVAAQAKWPHSDGESKTSYMARAVKEALAASRVVNAPVTNIIKGSMGNLMFTSEHEDGAVNYFDRGQFVDTLRGRGAIDSWVPDDLTDGVPHLTVALSDGPDIIVSATEIAEMNRCAF